MTGTIERDAAASFGLSVAGGMADDAGVDGLGFIVGEVEVRRCLRE